MNRIALVSLSVLVAPFLFPSLAAPSPEAGVAAVLPAERTTTWNPGLNAVGGIPVRTTVCATVTPRGGGLR